MGQVILGIDPGSIQTGYGVIHSEGGRLSYLGSGCVSLGRYTALPDRLKLVFDGITSIAEQFHPTMCAVEEPFMAKNSQTTIKLAEARGAAIVAARNLGLEVFEYTPQQIKLSVVGYGLAEKQQVQRMVVEILRLGAAPRTEDASDALACAICHATTYEVTNAMGGAIANLSSVHGRYRGKRGGRSRTWEALAREQGAGDGSV
ncbi:MAG: crossover junction endodeoxyribonuclease RuvC [Succinivibrionaceae bacterium]|nr:crossover junction endodeoxyribonuclease RuvC [Succinivibrionaceae bacterium]